MTRERLFSAFFFVGFFFLLYQLYLFLEPFSTPLILAVVLVLALAPLTARVLKVVGSRSWAALVMTLGTAAAVLVPMALLLSLLAEEAGETYDRLHQSMTATGASPLAVSQSWLDATRAWLVERVPVLASVDFSEIALQVSKSVSAWLKSETQSLAQNLLQSLVNALMLLVALFFLFRDGDRIGAALRDLIPMERADKERLSARLSDTVIAVVQSTVVIAILQGIVAGLGYFLIGGLSVSVLLGFLTGAASLVPVVGAALIWLPTGLYLMGTGELWRGLLLMLWGVLAVGSVDNFVRPLVIGRRVEMPTLLLLFALFGGLQVYGFLGIFVAPVVVAMLLVFVDLYRQHYLLAQSPDRGREEH